MSRLYEEESNRGKAAECPKHVAFLTRLQGQIAGVHSMGVGNRLTNSGR